MPDRRRPVSHTPTYSAYHAGNAKIPRFAYKVPRVARRASAKQGIFVLFTLVLSKTLPYIG
nr:MAG TPA: hypothetical protein [Caudoviricetes sp.]